MLFSIRRLPGYRLIASDGKAGKLRDLFFDDQDWAVRHLVADIGWWAAARRVLVSPRDVHSPDPERRVLPVALSSDQLRARPRVHTAPPISVQRAPLAPWACPPVGGAVLLLSEDTNGCKGDPHLRSANEVLGYRVEASDGRIGHLADLIVQTDGWRIRQVVVDTRNWLPGEKKTISPDRIAALDWRCAAVHVDMTRERLQEAPAPPRQVE